MWPGGFLPPVLMGPEKGYSKENMGIGVYDAEGEGDS